ncbi:hypothetical protein [Pseudomonas poae]|uniref:hypothetical protein n=1 Tax=Pseudomonas poae TaxID=200451 RepID=UPI0030CE7000
MSTISMNNVAGFKSDLNTANEAATQSLQTPEKPVNNLGFIPKNNIAPHLDNAEGGGKQVTVSADALDKMLEMFEMVLKAMRNFLSSWGSSSKLPVDVQSSPITLVKPNVQINAGAEGNVQVGIKDAGTQPKPASGEKDAQAKLAADGGLQIGVKGADSQTPPVHQEPMAKTKLGAEPGIQINARTDSPASVAPGAVKDESLKLSADGDAQVTVMPDGSTQVNLTPESGKQYRISLAAGVHVNVISNDGSSTVSSIKPRLIIDEPKLDERNDAAAITGTTTASQLRAEAKTLAATPDALKTEAEVKADAEEKVDTVLDAGGTRRPQRKRNMSMNMRRPRRRTLSGRPSPRLTARSRFAQASGRLLRALGIQSMEVCAEIFGRLCRYGLVAIFTR